MEPTSKDMYALGTRQNSQTRRHVTPMVSLDRLMLTLSKEVTQLHGFYDQYEQHHQGSASRSQVLSSWDNSSAGLTTSSGGTSGRRVDSRRSLLAGIGKLVASEDFGDELTCVLFEDELLEALCERLLTLDLSRPQLHLSDGFANPAAKVLLAENQYVCCLL
jgi:hypothetical protein